MKKKSQIKKNQLIIFVLSFFIAAYCVTTLYYKFHNNGMKYLYSQKSDASPVLYESRRIKLIKNLSLIDRILILGYSGGYVDSLDDLKKIDAGVYDFDKESVLKRINELGTCQLGGKTVSMYAYYDTYTLFGLPYKEFVITCKEVQSKSILDFLFNRANIKSLND